MNRLYKEHQHGVRPRTQQDETDICDACTDTMIRYEFSPAYATEGDAHIAWSQFGDLLIEARLQRAWTEMWDRFVCRNEDDCPDKLPCGDEPTWIAGGSHAIEVDGHVRWVLWLEIARQIQCDCFDHSRGAPQDVTPRNPVRKEPPGPEPSVVPLPVPPVPVMSLVGTGPLERRSGSAPSPRSAPGKAKPTPRKGKKPARGSRRR